MNLLELGREIRALGRARNQLTTVAVGLPGTGKGTLEKLLNYALSDVDFRHLEGLTVAALPADILEHADVFFFFRVCKEDAFFLAKKIDAELNPDLFLRTPDLSGRMVSKNEGTGKFEIKEFCMRQILPPDSNDRCFVNMRPVPAKTFIFKAKSSFRRLDHF